MTDVEITEVADFLGGHAPFTALPRPDVDRLARRLVVRYARRGTRLMAVGRGNDEVYVVRSGAVQIDDENGGLVERGGEGTCFGTTALRDEPSRFDVTAIEDSLLLVLPGAAYRDLVREHPDVADFFSEQRAGRIRSALDTVRVGERGRTVLQTRLRDLVRREPVTTTATATIREAAQVMSEQQVSSLLVTDGAGSLVGLVTDRDLRNRVLAVGRDPGEHVGAIMTADPVTASPDDLALELVLEMTSRNIHHMPVIEGDRALGMVTSTDLMRLEQANPIHLVGDIAKQADLDGLVAVASRLPLVVEQLVEQDATADGIGRISTAVGDAVERRLLELAEERLGPPPVPYCWVVLGSQARLEQGPASDQDNALVLADGAGPEAEAYARDLATYVVEGLVACGYPRCPGDVMATNPTWRRTVTQWHATFAEWMQAPVPAALLNAAIFFDMRAVHGDRHLVDELHARIAATAPGSQRFLAHLAGHAAANEPPLGFFRGLVLERRGEHKDTLDLKRGGVGAVVELARVLALSKGLPQLNTHARLGAAASAGALSHGTAADLQDAFEFIRYVRLGHQARQIRAGRAPDNFISPDELSGFEKRHLRDAFQIVRSAQQTIARSHPLGYFS